MNSISPGEALGNSALFLNPLPSQTGETNRPTETDSANNDPLPVGSDAAILILTRNAADIELKRMQEQQARREQQGSTEEDQARQAAAREAHRQSLKEQQGLGSFADDAHRSPSLINNTASTTNAEGHTPIQALDLAALAQNPNQIEPPSAGLNPGIEPQANRSSGHVDLLA